MRLTFIVSIDPVKELSLLNVLIHSFNLQTSRRFNVVFYNQTLLDEEAIFSRLRVRPAFDYVFHGVDRKRFFGRYPLWDLYEVHSTLLDSGAVNEYVMSLHMEEFLDVDYVEHVLRVLEDRRFDIMFGNLSRTRMDCQTIEPLMATRTAAEFDRYLEERGLKRSYHWAFRYDRWRGWGNGTRLREEMLKLYLFGFRRRVKSTRSGFRKLAKYAAEDLYFMSRDFARRYNWFLPGHHMYFEDIHICQQEGVCELDRELRKITEFPIYFNRRRIYHVDHGRYYFQLADEEFTEALLAYHTDDPGLGALKKAIAMYKGGEASLEQALAYSRRNPASTGTQNLNYAYHLKYLNEARARAPEASGRGG